MLDPVSKHDLAMFIAQALGVTSAAEIDPTRSLRIGNLEVGPEATDLARRFLEGTEELAEVHVRPSVFDTPVYWLISHHAEGSAELFGFPPGIEVGLPTAIELGLIVALASSEPALHEQIILGGAEIILGRQPTWKSFRSVYQLAKCPSVGPSVFFGPAKEVLITDDMPEHLESLSLNCFSSSFSASPLKFRFLELYRVMEAHFLHEVKANLINNFDAGPNSALADAVDALKSEGNQIKGLASKHTDLFEGVRARLHVLKNTNRFAASLFRRLSQKGRSDGAAWETGAALVYQIRCAIVHAGQKDMIFESFPDGEEVLHAVIDLVELSALRFMGLRIVE